MLSSNPDLQPTVYHLFSILYRFLLFMKKNVFGRKFKRDRNERKALFKALLSSLVLHKKINTTEEKAKAIKGQADKLVTKVKRSGSNILTARKLISPYLIPAAMETFIQEIVPQFADRAGGYTRVVRLGKRFNDDAKMVAMEWVNITAAAIIPNGEVKKIAKAAKKEAKVSKEPQETKVKEKKVEPKEKKEKVKKEKK